MAQPVWVTPAGDLGTIAEGVFYQTPLEAYDPGLDTVYYRLLAGALPAGMQINDTGLVSGVPQAKITIQGVPEPVGRDVTSKFAVRAYTQQVIHGVTVINRLADRTFEITVAGQDAPEFITAPGQIAQIYDGSVISGIQVRYTDPDPDEVLEVRLLSGSLPPGLSIDSQGLISGIVPPQNDNANYEFTLEVTDGKVNGSSVRSFSIYVYSRIIMTADVQSVTPTSNARMSADNNFLTADNYNVYVPFLTNTPGNIGSVRSDNWFAYKFNGTNLSGDSVKYQLTSSSPPLSNLGLTLDPTSGWLYGYIPNLGFTDVTYDFTIRVYLNDGNDPPFYISGPYNFNIEITGPINTEVVWLTPSNLGTIDNGSTSIFYVEALAQKALQYELKSGSTSNLPQGLELLPSGEIAGRVSFNTFALDQGTTTFDVEAFTEPTTFDMKFTFTVRAYSVDGLIDVFKTFSITVIRAYNEPYENLYIQAMPPQDDRDLIASLIQNTEIFPVDLIYRFNDPNFGVAKNVKYYHAYGLTSATLPSYVESLNLNHYWKNLVLGEIQVAQARDADDTVIYEVVYSRIIDDLVNDRGESVSKEVTLPYPINKDDSTEIATVYPNSLINMRDQVIDTVGQVSNVLPLWMTSKQNDGRVLGFVPAWIIAYTKPERGNQIAYYIRENFFDTLNLVDYEVDRYELDGLLSKNWDPYAETWIPTPAQTYFDYENTPTVSQWGNFSYTPQPTVFTAVTWTNSVGNAVTWTNSYDGDETVFDGNSLKFIEPVDMYSNTQAYDKYLVFPKRNILQ